MLGTGILSPHFRLPERVSAVMTHLPQLVQLHNGTRNEIRSALLRRSAAHSPTTWSAASLASRRIHDSTDPRPHRRWLAHDHNDSETAPISRTTAFTIKTPILIRPRTAETRSGRYGSAQLPESSQADESLDGTSVASPVGQDTSPERPRMVSGTNSRGIDIRL